MVKSTILKEAFSFISVFTANYQLSTSFSSVPTSVFTDYFRTMRKLLTGELNRLSVEEFRSSEKLPLITVLENIRSAYNVGSFFRTADAFRLEGVYLVGYTAFPPHKELKKTALGAEETVHWKHFKTSTEAIADLRGLGYAVFAVEQAAESRPLQHFAGGTKVAMVFGNEVTGVEQTTIAACDGCVEIPQLGMKHSLNVATAGGIVLWELVRQKLLLVQTGFSSC